MTVSRLGVGAGIVGIPGGVLRLLRDAGDAGHLGEYVRGQLSNLPRKSVQPMADLAGVPPRTLQEFLSLSDWDHQCCGTRCSNWWRRDHGDEDAIGIVDESGHPKKGERDRVRAAAVLREQRQGRQLRDERAPGLRQLGRRVPHDAGLRPVPAPEAGDREEGEEAERGGEAAGGVPEGVRYRPKYDIALEQLDRATANGRASRLGDRRRVVRGEAFVYRGAGTKGPAFRAAGAGEPDGLARTSRPTQGRAAGAKAGTWSAGPRRCSRSRGSSSTSRTRARGRWCGRRGRRRSG